MTTPRLRTNLEAVIVASPTRIILPSTSAVAAAVFGISGRYSVLLLFIHMWLDAIHLLTTSKQPSMRRRIADNVVAVRSK